MVTVQTVLYLCVKFQNFPASGSMGCHKLPEWKMKRKNKKGQQQITDDDRVQK